MRQHWFLHKPSLFQHIGVHSSLKGKVQKLKEKDFGKTGMHTPVRKISDQEIENKKENIEGRKLHESVRTY